MKKSVWYVLILAFGLALPNWGCQSNAASKEATTAEAQAAQPKPPFENIDVPAFREKMATDNVVVVDVRTPGETQKGMIDGALAIDINASDFRQKISALDKSKTYLVYCQSGGRSSRACSIMAEMGFERLYNLEEGYSAWPE